MRKTIIYWQILLLWYAIGDLSAQGISNIMTAPEKNGHYDFCSDLKLAAEVTVTTGTVRQVEFFLNGTKFKTVTKEPFEAEWPSVREGIYLVHARAVAGDGSEALSEPYYVYVGNPAAGNVIINGDFNCGLSPWFLDNYVNARSTVTVDPELSLTEDKPGVIVEIQNQGDQFWAIQLMQPFKIKAGHSYEISFWAQADAAKDVFVDINKNYGDYSQLFSQKVVVDQLDLYGPYVFDAGVDDDNLMFKFVLGGNTTTFYLDAVKVIDQQWTQVETPQPVAVFSLMQNYPNPFNPRTTIEYICETSGSVDLTIFSVMGGKVAHYSTFAPAGRNAFVWDGADLFGKACPSGVYFYQLETAAGRMVKKMQLIR